MRFCALGGHGGGDGVDGQHGGEGFKYGAFLTFLNIHFWIRLDNRGTKAIVSHKVLMALLVATEEMAVTQVKAVMVDVE